MVLATSPTTRPTLSTIRNLGFEWRDPDSGFRSTELTVRFFDLLELITPQIDLYEGVEI
jgi:hypothetical protein